MIWQSIQRVNVATMIIAGSMLLSRVIGLIRDMTISRWFGAGQETDIYFAAFVVPDFINYLLAGAYFSITLIPFLVKAFEVDFVDGWRFFSAVFCWMLVISSSFTLIAMIYAPMLARVAAPGFDAIAVARLARFLRIILPAQVFFIVGSCLSAILYLRKQFLVPALMPIIYNSAIIGLGISSLGGGMEGFCWGVFIGSCLGNLILPLLVILCSGKLSLVLCFRHPDLKRFLAVTLPLMIGQSVVVLDEQLLRIFGSLAGIGTVSWLNYARRIMLVPVSIVAQAVGITSFPLLAQLAIHGDFKYFDMILRVALRNTTLLLLPLGMWMFVAAESIVAIIFQQGCFSSVDTAATVICLRVMLISVTAWGVLQILSRAFYAHQDTFTPAWAGSLTTIAVLPLYWLFTEWWGAIGVTLASLTAVLGYALAISLLWRRRFGANGLTDLGRTLAWGITLSLAAALPTWLLLKPLWKIISLFPLLGHISAIVVSGVCFSLVFICLGQLCAPPQLLQPIIDQLKQIIWRSFR